VALEVLRRVPGRVVLIERSGVIHIGRNYEILRSDDDGATWSRVAALPRSPWRRAAEFSRLACRLVRQEVRALLRLPGGAYVAANREGVFFGGASRRVLAPSRIDGGDLPVMPPMRLCAGPDGTVVWGEYGCPRSPRAVRLFASSDSGASFRPVHTFPTGEILHVHNVLWDESDGHYWVLAGDHDEHPGIGRLTSDFQRFEWLVKGSQLFRAVHAFDLGDRLLYATDTEKEVNRLVSLDKATGRAAVLREFDGSCIYACRFGDIYALTTTVEPSEVNRSRDAQLWISRDAETWHCAWRAPKDRWHPDYFQFGSLVLPAGSSDRDTVFVSGQAVKGLDGQTLVARLGSESRG